jgi:hypothetical protein
MKQHKKEETQKEFLLFVYYTLQKSIDSTIFIPLQRNFTNLT